MEDAAHEDLQMRRGERQQGCERAACHGVGIERIGNGQVERPYCPGDNAFRTPLGKESGWQDLMAVGMIVCRGSSVVSVLTQAPAWFARTDGQFSRIVAERTWQ